MCRRYNQLSISPCDDGRPPVLAGRRYGWEAFLMSRILLVAETGSDLTPALAAQNGVTLVPMHVSFGGKTLDDGAFPVTEMFDHYKTTRELPRTSGCTPHDFEVVFERLLRENPDAQILHLAYSACTTCSMQSAVIAAQGNERIVSVDTKSVTAGQTAIILRVAAFLRAHPDATMDEALEETRRAVAQIRMAFFPGDLDYLRAGGRVSNAAYLGAMILGLHPLIEIDDGKLVSTKKYRGSMERVVKKLMGEYPDRESLDRRELYLIYGRGLSERLMREVEASAAEQGFEKVTWVETGCVIAAHSGPGAFGIVGFSTQA